MEMAAARVRSRHAALTSFAAWYAQQLALLRAAVAGHFSVALSRGAWLQ
jgi:hypothetical protein